MNSDQLTTILGGVASVGVGLQQGLIKVPETKQELFALGMAAAVALLGYLTNKQPVKKQ